MNNLTSYNDIFRLLDRNFDGDLRTASEFEQQCKKYGVSAKTSDIPVWCDIIKEKSIYYRQSELKKTDIDVLKAVCDLGYTLKPNQHNTYINISIDYDFESLQNDDKYKPLLKFLEHYLEIDKNTKYTIELINSITPRFVLKVLETRRRVKYNNNSFEEVLYHHRDEMSPELRQEMKYNYYKTNNGLMKLFLALMLDKNDTISFDSYITLHTSQSSFVYIKGTFNKIRTILDEFDLEEYYRNLDDIEKIENVEHLLYILNLDKHHSLNAKFAYRFEHNFSTLHILRFMLVDESKTIQMFGKLREIDTFKNLYKHIEESKPDWKQFATLYRTLDDLI